MIYPQEILKGKICPKDFEDNLLELLIKINKVRDAYSKPMTVTSGFRSLEDQINIYKANGLTRIPMKSKHLFAQAIDIYDPNSDLQNWILNNIKLIEEIGLWMEDFTHTKNWIHSRS